MQVRPSRVLRKLRNGENVVCTKINLSDSRVTEIVALCGFDCLWLDMEHVPTDWQTVQSQINSAKIYDVDVMVRIAKGSYSNYIVPFEADSAGIMVPHLMSLEEARDVVYWTRFHPLGRRPVDGGNADGKYCMVDFNQYLQTANQERFVILQIEDPEPLDELDEIVKIEGFDMLFFGPGDFSQGIGTPGKWDNPKIEGTRRLIAEVCRKNNKYAGTVATADNFDELVNMGYQFISVGADVVGLWSYYNSILSKITKKENNDLQNVYKGK